MPIYEYQCQKCGYKFEELIFEGSKIKCQKCDSKFLKKLFFSFVTKKSSENSTKNDDYSCPTCKY